MALLHVVALGLDAAPGAELAEVMAGLGALAGRIDGFDAFAHGPNVDVEGKTPDHPYAFVCTFRDRAALAAYAEDPRHRALGARLVALCGGDPDRIRVYDIETA